MDLLLQMQKKLFIVTHDSSVSIHAYCVRDLILLNFHKKIRHDL